MQSERLAWAMQRRAPRTFRGLNARMWKLSSNEMHVLRTCALVCPDDISCSQSLLARVFHRHAHIAIQIAQLHKVIDAKEEEQESLLRWKVQRLLDQGQQSPTRKDVH